MTDTEWQKCSDPAAMIAFLDGTVGPRKQRLFGCACVRWVCSFAKGKLPDAVLTAEDFADGKAAKAALARARKEVRAERHALEESGAKKPAVWGAYWLTEVVASENASGSVLSELHRFSSDLIVLTSKHWKTVGGLLRDIYQNPHRPAAFNRRWRTTDIVALARAIYDDRAFDRLPLLADALMDAGCDDEQVIGHCRGPAPHVRGCWVVDLVLGRE
jgi:hypothetical protein